MLPYNSPQARRLRQVRRIAKGLATTSLDRRLPRFIRSFWWDGHPNFGDELTPWLLPRLGIIPVLRTAARASLIGVGSILEMVPEDSHAMVWGSGLMHRQERRMPNAQFLAVRGPMTRDLLNLDQSTPLGDPGLLVSEFIPRPQGNRRIALVQHGIHDLTQNAFHALLANNPRELYHVRTDQSVSEVVSQIAAADLVVSSSLHGLIVADAYGIPASWAIPSDAAHDVADMKFSDYHQTVLGSFRRRMVTVDADTSIDDLRRAAVRAEAEKIGKVVQQLRRVICESASIGF